jgi:hypothetical protein
MERDNRAALITAIATVLAALMNVFCASGVQRVSQGGKHNGGRASSFT